MSAEKESLGEELFAVALLMLGVTVSVRSRSLLGGRSPAREHLSAQGPVASWVTSVQAPFFGVQLWRKLRTPPLHFPSSQPYAGTSFLLSEKTGSASGSPCHGGPVTHINEGHVPDCKGQTDRQGS